MEKTALAGFVAISAVLVLLAGSARPEITPAAAKNYIGKSETVCGQVASANYAPRNRGRPTFLNLDRAYPNHIFTVVIWGNDRVNFRDAPERAYDGKRIC